MTSTHIESSSNGRGKFLYIQNNDPLEGQNAILGYRRLADGSLVALPGNPFYTGGTGVNNDTHAKLGPNDNDTPLTVTPDGRSLFAVNTHSNTIAAFDVRSDGALQHVKDSPVSSHGIAPNSLSVSGKTLLVSNRNEDYHQLESLRGAEMASYVSYAIEESGTPRFVSKVDVDNFQKPTQVFHSLAHPGVAFGNDFQVDADFDGAGTRSFLAGTESRVQGQLHVFEVCEGSQLMELARLPMPETNEGYKYKGMDGVPSMPLGIWTHPTKPLLYVGLVTRNEVGVYRFNVSGEMTFLGAVANSGQDICWVLPNADGSRLYTINNLPRTDLNGTSATVSTYDISGVRAVKPVEIATLPLPYPGTWFVNNRMFEQPGSTAFQCALDPEETMLYVICQRVNQTAENESEDGNFIHGLSLGSDGIPSVAFSRALGPDGVQSRCRPQGIVTIDH